MAQNTPILSLPWAELTDSANAQTGFKSLAESMDTVGIPRFPSTAARDAAIPTPIEGMVCYVSAAGVHQLQLYTNGSWQELTVRDTFARKTTDEIVNLTATLQNDNELFLPLLASATYRVSGIVQYSAINTVGLRSAWTFPAGATLALSMIGALGSATTNGADSGYWLANGETASSPAPEIGLGTLNDGGGTPYRIQALVNGYIIMGATPGNLQYQWAQITVNAATLTVYAGSFLHAVKVG